MALLEEGGVLVGYSFKNTRWTDRHTQIATCHALARLATRTATPSHLTPQAATPSPVSFTSPGHG